jgi:hypothetical protein
MKTDYKDFQQEILIRGIECLIHFTPTTNLHGILKHGKIMSRRILEDLITSACDISNQIRFTDKVRYDDKSFINLSISFPNHFLLSRFRRRAQKNHYLEWCILKIDTKHIYKKDTKFSVTNASSSAARTIGITGDFMKFKQMFANEINIPHGIRENLHSKHPTNVQAEVLVKDEIPATDILAVCFSNENELAARKATLTDYDTSKFVVDTTLFGSKRI